MLQTEAFVTLLKETAGGKDMDKIQLTLNQEYIAHWTVYDALRELFQNMIDCKTVDEQSDWYYNVKSAKNKVDLELVTEHTTLSKSTLLLGTSTKTDDKQTIGQFGEGYKLALLVLLRNRIAVKIRTGKEIWRPSLEYNELFKANILVINIEEADNITQDTTFTLYSLPKKIWSGYSQYNLYLQENLKEIKTELCSILLDDRNRKKIFVNGLYVCNATTNVLYGYNFKPEVFPLGRDRQLIDGWDLMYRSSRALIEAAENSIDLRNNVVNNVGKVEELEHLKYHVKEHHTLVDVMWTKFNEEYPNSIPVDSQLELKRMRNNYVGAVCVTVTQDEFALLKRSKGYREAIQNLEQRPPRKQPSIYIQELIDNNTIPKELEETIYTLLIESKTWSLDD